MKTGKNNLLKTSKLPLSPSPLLLLGVLLCLLLALPTPALHAQSAVRGTVVAWGQNFEGQSNVPADLSDVIALAAGSGHSLALKRDGTVVGWGANGYGQSSIPAGLSAVIAVSAGSGHSLVLKRDGTVVTWGRNDYGQGIAPADLSDVIAISAGAIHNLALKRDGTVVGWGDAGYLRLPIPADLNNVTAISAGSYHNLALKADGTLVSWGGDQASLDVPAGLSGVTAISTGEFYSLALKDDGTVVVWGSSFYGPLNIPVGLSGVTAIAAGGRHALALKDDGTVVAWGFNSNGQIDVPASLSGVGVITAGSFHSLALVRPPDITTPTASPSQSPVATAAGWNNTDVIVTWNWSDNAATSGPPDGIDPANCTTSSVSSGEGEITLNATCTDLAGNTGSVTYMVKVDKSAPTLNPTVSPNPVTQGAVATASAGASDVLSGIATLHCDPLDTSTPGVKSVTCTATDNAGNTASATTDYMVTAVVLSQLQQVQTVRTSLATLLPSGDSKTDKALQKAIAKLDQALASDLWQADGNHLTLKGEKAFHRVRDAVKELVKSKNPPQVVTVSRTLAQTALDEALAAGGNAAKIAKAQKEMNKGDQDRNQGKAANAISHYEEAWEYAQQAVGNPVLAASDPAEPDAASAEEAHVHIEEAEAQSNTLFLPVVVK